MRYEYSEVELQQLHLHLYKIAAEFDRVCRKHDINYFIIGGTAIGAFYWDGIIPWDDDIDIGMRRKDYERFLEIAPHELDGSFFLQWVGTDAHTPFWFTKIRENNTLFKESQFKKADIHHGISIDVFPFDNIPASRLAERLQYAVFGFFNACFIGKDIWQWKYCGNCEVEEPRPRGFLTCLLTRLVVLTCSKTMLYKALRFVQNWFNGLDTAYCKNIMTEKDKVRIKDITPPQEVRFGALKLKAPNRLEDYLRTHYTVLNKHLPKEQQINHRPAELSFDTRSKSQGQNKE